MAEEKIRISIDEVNSSEVDAKIKQQEMLGRAQQHYQQQAAPSLSTHAVPLQQASKSIWYNSLFCMTAFGLFGGLIGALSGEFAYQAAMPDRVAEYEAVDFKLAPLLKNWEEGQISDSEFQSRVDAIADRYAGNAYLDACFDDSLSESEREARLEQLEEEDSGGSFLATFLLLVCAGVSIAVALAVAEPLVSRNSRAMVINASVALTAGAIGAVVGGFCIGILYSFLGGGQDLEITFRQIVARAVGWAGLGAFLAAAPGIVLKNSKRTLIGIAGGTIGGFLGGLLFDPVWIATGSLTLSRVIGITAIGLIAGAGTGLIENAAKTGWLRVVAGLIAGKQFVVYKNPSYIGSSPQCEIYLFKDSQVGPRHAAIHTIPGGFEIEDQQSPTGTFVNGEAISRSRLRSGDQIQIGATVLLFQEKEQTVN